MSTPVRRVCDYLNRYCREGSLETALHVGEHVVTELLAGDVSKLGSEGDEHPSIRELSALLAEEQVLSSTTLWRYLGVYALFVRKQLFGKISDYGMVMPLVGLPPAVQDSLLTKAAAQSWKAPRMKAEAAAKRPPRRVVAPGALAARQLKKAVGLVSGLADLPEPARVSHVKQLGPLVGELLARWKELTRAPQASTAAEAPSADGSPDLAAPDLAAPDVAAPDVAALDLARLAATAVASLGASAIDPTHVLTQADAGWALAGLPAPAQDDVVAYFGDRAALLGAHDTLWAAEAAAPPALAAFLDGADRLELRYGPGLAAQLDLCIAAQLVLARPALAARTTVSWGGSSVPLAEVAPVLGEVWRAFHAPSPTPWDDLRRRDLPPDLAAAVLAWLGELPDPWTGLGATQRELLLATRVLGRIGEVVEAIGRERASLFRPHVVERMAVELCAAGALEGLPRPVSYVGWRPDEVEDELRGRLHLTDLGSGLLDGYGDLMATEDRWWGGTHLTSASRWRWDRKFQVLIEL